MKHIYSKRDGQGRSFLPVCPFVGFVHCFKLRAIVAPVGVPVPSIFLSSDLAAEAVVAAE